MRPLLGRPAALAIAEAATKAALTSGAEQAEALLLTADSQVSRYSLGRVHQQVGERNLELRIRAVIGRRQAVAAGNQTDGRAIKRLADRATAIARLSPEDPNFPGLPAPARLPYVDQTTFYESTAALDDRGRAEAVQAVFASASEWGAEAHGVVTNGVSELTVVNTRGIAAYQAFTDAWMSVIVEQTSGRTGYAAAAHRDWSELNPADTVAQALEKLAAPASRRIPPGRYMVLLEEYAVAELFDFLATEALNGLLYLEGRSLYSRRLGQRPYPSWITIRDEPTDARGANASFDFEGVTKAPLTHVREGYLEQVAWDSATAFRAGEESTGHALPAPNPGGPIPLNLMLVPGQASQQELVRQMDRGLLVTRLHYVNPVDPAKTLLTGMTRDGTFLVEKGEIVAAVQDLRWVQSIDEVLARAVAVGRDARLVSWGPGYGMRFLTGHIVPPLLVEGFQVTGSAEE